MYFTAIFIEKLIKLPYNSRSSENNGDLYGAFIFYLIHILINHAGCTEFKKCNYKSKFLQNRVLVTSHLKYRNAITSNVTFQDSTAY